MTTVFFTNKVMCRGSCEPIEGSRTRFCVGSHVLVIQPVSYVQLGEADGANVIARIASWSKEC